MDVYTDRTARPMLIGRTQAAFDDDEFLFELKLDGERCLAFLDPAAGECELLNRRGRRLGGKMPELESLYTRVRHRCILDGELVVMHDGKPDFERMKQRWALSNGPRIEAAARENPVSFVAFDILYKTDGLLTRRPLAQRKRILEQVATGQDARFSVQRTVAGQGKALFRQTQVLGLEGIVAKRLDGAYHMGKRSGDWVKCKNLFDDDFVICGYLVKPGNAVASLVLGQYTQAGALVYKGRVTLALSGGDFARIKQHQTNGSPPLTGAPVSETRGTVWLVPTLVCTVQYTQRTPQGGNRHPVFKGLRTDKPAREATEST